MYGKITAGILLLGTAAVLLSLQGYSNYATEHAKPAALSAASLADVSVTASAWGVFDPKSGDVIAGEEIDTPRSIASITKLFTTYAVLESDRLWDETKISWADLNTEGDSGKLSYGETYTGHALLFPLLIESSNDAATALERLLGIEYETTTESVFEELALTETVLTDTSGLSAGNVSTVSELARFYAHFLETKPHGIDITRLPMYITEEVGLVNTSSGLAFPGYRGGKQGFTYEAGKTYIGTFTVQSGAEVGVVLLGSTDLASDLEAIIGGR